MQKKEAKPEDHDDLKHTLGQTSEAGRTHEEANKREQHEETENEVRKRVPP